VTCHSPVDGATGGTSPPGCTAPGGLVCHMANIHAAIFRPTHAGPICQVHTTGQVADSASRSVIGTPSAAASRLSASIDGLAWPFSIADRCWRPMLAAAAAA
jgi:hypothetical protein